MIAVILGTALFFSDRAYRLSQKAGRREQLSDNDENQFPAEGN